MKFLPDHFEIIIIGAGPAGTTAAIRLLEMGHTVCLIEQETFPREQIGESLSPGIRNIFAYLGAEALLNHDQYLSHIPARVRWDSREPAYVGPEQRGPGIVVDRGLLDQQLLSSAVSKGLTVFQPAKLISSVYDEGVWKLNIQTGSSLQAVYSSVVLDARGRKGSHLHERLKTAPPSVAIWSHVSAQVMPRETLIEAIDEGWLWGSPVPGNRYRLMAFMDSDALKGKNLSLYFSKMLAKAGLFGSAGSELADAELQTCPVTSFVHTQPWDRQFIKIGEAAFTLDPLSSTGVEKAMRFSMQTAIAVHTLLGYDQDIIAQAFYEEKLIESAVNHAHWTAGYYGSSWAAGKRFPFWEKRAGFQLDVSKISNDFTERFCQKFNQPRREREEKERPAVPVNALLHHLWDKPVQLSPDLTFTDEFAVTADRIEVKRAMNHPNLETPLIYLNQIELSPLFGSLRDGTTYGALIENWDKYLPTEDAKKIVAFLWSHGILVSS